MSVLAKDLVCDRILNKPNLSETFFLYVTESPSVQDQSEPLSLSRWDMSKPCFVHCVTKLWQFGQNNSATWLAKSKTFAACSFGTAP